MTNNKVERLSSMVKGNTLIEMVELVNNCNRSLDYLGYLGMNLFEEYLSNVSRLEVANMVHYGNFNSNDDFFRFDDDGNLVSYTKGEVLEDMENNKEDILERLMELYEEGYINIWDEEIKTILDEE